MEFRYEARLAPTKPLSEEEPMVDRADPTGGALELARSAAPAPARRITALAALARPAGEVARLLLVEVLGSPRAWATALGLARWLAGRRPPTSASVEMTTRQVTVARHADSSVLVHRVETTLVVCAPWERPAVGPQTMSNPRAARDNSGKRTGSQTGASYRSPHVRRPPRSSLQATVATLKA
jgi:hypothetical protein